MPSAPSGVTTRAERGLGNNTAQPPLTSGFGAVIEKEYELQAATKGSRGPVSGHHSRDIDRILLHQQSRLGANIALLEQRYEALPHPERFASWSERPHATNTALGLEGRDELQVLRELIARHARLGADAEALIECAPDGQRGELILREVSRNHHEMARMLTAMLKEDATSTPVPVREGGGDRALERTSEAEESGDEEGGLVGPFCRRIGFAGPPGDLDQHE